MADWQTPKTDWVTNPKNPVSEDFKRIEGNIDFLKTDIETKKGLIVDAINDMNQPAEVTDTHAELAEKIRDISNDANAAVSDVLSGKTFYQGGIKRTGTMPNRGQQIITPGTSNITIPAGYHNGTGYVVGDSDLVASNIREGKNIFGIAGNLKEGIPNFLDWSAYSTEKNWAGTVIDVPATTWHTFLNISGQSGYLVFCRGFSLETYSAMPDVRITVDGIAYVFQGFPSSYYATGNLILQPIRFNNSLKIEVYNNYTAAREMGCDYTYLRQITSPDISKHTLINSSSRKLDANSTGSTTLTDVANVSGSGYLLGVVLAPGYDSTSNYCTLNIVIDGVTIVPDRTMVTPQPYYWKMFELIGPVRFNQSLLVQHRILAGSGTRIMTRAWYTLD